MKVKELIEQLAYLDEDAEVKFVYDYGDCCHRQVAVDIVSVDPIMVKYSSYTDSDVMIDDDYEVEEYDEKTSDGSRREVIGLLSSL
jgi:hypothetical protein